MNRIARRELKRKRELQRRRKCHKSVFSCHEVHPSTVRIPPPPVRVLVPEKKQLSVWRRLTNWLWS